MKEKKVSILLTERECLILCGQLFHDANEYMRMADEMKKQSYHGRGMNHRAEALYLIKIREKFRSKRGDSK